MMVIFFDIIIISVVIDVTISMFINVVTLYHSTNYIVLFYYGYMMFIRKPVSRCKSGQTSANYYYLAHVFTSSPY